MGFLYSGDGARFVALRADEFEARFAGLPRCLPVPRWEELVLIADAGEEVFGVRLASRRGDLAHLEPGAGRILVEACVEACAAERWRAGACHGDFSAALGSPRLASLDGPGRAAWEQVAGILSPSPHDEPWWLRAALAGCCAYALHAPARVAALAEALASTGVMHAVAAALRAAPAHDAADDFPGLGDFLARAAGRGDWVLAAEWR